MVVHTDEFQQATALVFLWAPICLPRAQLSSFSTLKVRPEDEVRLVFADSYAVEFSQVFCTFLSFSGFQLSSLGIPCQIRLQAVQYTNVQCIGTTFWVVTRVKPSIMINTFCCKKHPVFSCLFWALYNAKCNAIWCLPTLSHSATTYRSSVLHTYCPYVVQG